VDFLEFRDFLIPASGFQSVQLREIEITMGLTDNERIPLDGKSYREQFKDHSKKLHQNISNITNTTRPNTSEKKISDESRTTQTSESSPSSKPPTLVRFVSLHRTYRCEKNYILFDSPSKLFFFSSLIHY
jgi:tryptophan 2,3-dioxygenase